MPERKIDVIEFARRVEKLCDFYLDKLPITTSNDKYRREIQDLKEDAANIHTGVLTFSTKEL